MKALSPNAEKVLALIRKEGATSTSRVVSGLELPWREAKTAIVELISAGAVSWTGGLPRQGVFFVLPENGRKGAFGLLAKNGALTREAGGIRRVSRRVVEAREGILSYLREDPTNPASIENIVQDGSGGLSVGSVRRHLAALESQGLVKQVPQRTGKRGRPWAGWMPVPDDQIPVVTLGHDALTVRINDGAALKAMRTPDR